MKEFLIKAEASLRGGKRASGSLSILIFPTRKGFIEATRFPRATASYTEYSLGKTATNLGTIEIFKEGKLKVIHMVSMLHEIHHAISLWAVKRNKAVLKEEDLRLHGDIQAELSAKVICGVVNILGKAGYQLNWKT